MSEVYETDVLQDRGTREGAQAAEEYWECCEADDRVGTKFRYGPSEWVTVVVCGDWTPNHVNVQIASVAYNSEIVPTGRIHRNHPLFADIARGGVVRIRRNCSSKLQLL